MSTSAIRSSGNMKSTHPVAIAAAGVPGEKAFCGFRSGADFQRRSNQTVCNSEYSPASRTEATDDVVISFAERALGTTSGQLSERKRGFLVPKRHHMKHLEF